MKLLAILNSALVFFNCLIFAYYALKFFKKVKVASFFTYLLKFCAIASMFIQTMFILNHSRSAINNIVSVIIAAISSYIFFATLIKNSKRNFQEVSGVPLSTFLATDGTYKLVRHPFYLSYLLTYLSGVLATLHFIVIIQSIIMAGLYVIAAKKEEKTFLESELADKYRSYRLTTKMIIPWIY